jgi:magnesium-transporting ATPase (P-type)
VNESAFNGDARDVNKQSLHNYNFVTLDQRSICFSNTTVLAGHAVAIALAVGENSTAADRVKANDAEEDKDD